MGTKACVMRANEIPRLVEAVPTSSIDVKRKSRFGSASTRSVRPSGANNAFKGRRLSHWNLFSIDHADSPSQDQRGRVQNSGVELSKQKTGRAERIVRIPFRVR